MKTIPKWYEELPEPYNIMALNNLEERPFTILYPSLSEAICAGFPWDESNEDFNFWNGIYENLLYLNK